MPTDPATMAILEDKANWAEKFAGDAQPTTKLVTRWRHALDQSAYAQALVDQQAAEQEHERTTHQAAQTLGTASSS